MNTNTTPTTYEARVATSYARFTRRHPAHAVEMLARMEASGFNDSGLDWLRATTIRSTLRTLGRCERCGRTLTDPDSVTRGIGPECARRES